MIPLYVKRFARDRVVPSRARRVRSGRSTRRTRTSLMASLSLLSLSTLSPSGPSCSARAFSDSRPPPRAPAGAGALRAVRGAVSVQRCNAAVLCSVQSGPRRCGGRGATCARVRGRSAGAVVWPQGGLLSTHTRTHRTPTALNGTSTLGYFGVLTVLSSLYVPHTRPRPATAPRWRSCCCRCLPSTRGQWGRASSQEQRALRLLSVLGYSQPQPPRPPHPPRPPQLAPPRSPPAP